MTNFFAANILDTMRLF